VDQDGTGATVLLADLNGAAQVDAVGNSDDKTAPKGLSCRAGASLGLAVLLFSVLYLISDGIEALQGGFSDFQLLLTLVAEAAIPVLVLGLYSAQRPRIGRLGLLSAIAYAYAFVFFTGTVLYALVDHTSDYSALSEDLGALMTFHGAIMVFAGIGFGIAVLKAGVLPAWTGFALGAGVVLVAATQTAPEAVQLVAAAVRDLGFMGMGFALWQTRSLPLTADARLAPAR
jgi:hypothetical protein